MPTAYGAEFRQDVIDVARKGEAPLAQIAKDFGLSVTTLKRWMAIAERRTRGRRRNTSDPVWANRRLLLRAAETASTGVLWDGRCNFKDSLFLKLAPQIYDPRWASLRFQGTAVGAGLDDQPLRGQGSPSLTSWTGEGKVVRRGGG